MRAVGVYPRTRPYDIFMLARAALKAAIRSENDLIDLLNEANPPHQAKAAAVVATQAQA
jgi:hypothetical protein